jgi:hypothetical protein
MTPVVKTVVVSLLWVGAQKCRSEWLQMPGKRGRDQMKRLVIVLLAVGVALAIAMPAGAKKPDGPDKPSTGFKPMACQVDDVFGRAIVTNASGTVDVTPDNNQVFTLNATTLGGFNETRYTVEPDTPGFNDDVLCVEVTLVDGNLSDLRVRWYHCQNCGLYRATGKDLRNFNNHEVFSAGVSVSDWSEMTVAVMPFLKSDTAELTVKIGIDRP